MGKIHPYMNTVSFWKQITKEDFYFPELTSDLEVDVVIIGGGITGITTAQKLFEAGKKVALIEAQSVGGGTTGYSTGNLYVPVQPMYHHIAKSFDLKTVGQVAEARMAAISHIEKMVQEYS